jgi:hypothetical protein
MQFSFHSIMIIGQLNALFAVIFSLPRQLWPTRSVADALSPTLEHQLRTYCYRDRELENVYDENNSLNGNKQMNKCV